MPSSRMSHLAASLAQFNLTALIRGALLHIHTTYATVLQPRGEPYLFS